MANEASEELATHRVWALTEDQKTKVGNLLRIGATVPFGQVLAQSEAVHSAYLWHIIANDSAKVVM